MSMIGIVGGMGPQATIDLYQKIIDNTKASKDQDHIHTVIDSYAQIPERTSYLKGKGESPLPYILKSIENITKCFRPSVLCMPCNTAHYFIKEIRNYTKIPFISIVESVIDDIKKSEIKYKKIGLLATDGTIIGKVYHVPFEENGIVLHNVDESSQQLIMRAIYLVKAGQLKKATNELNTAIARIVDGGFNLLIAGCTEIPILIPYLNIKAKNVQIMDATKSLARHVVDYCKS